MLAHWEPVQLLVNLGLTVLQSRVYIALVMLGTSTGRVTAKAAKVASQDVYRVLTELQEEGMVEKIIAKPNKYRPIPLEEGFSMLLQRRNKQTAELARALKKTVFEISKSFQSIDKREYKVETCDFVLISGKEAIEHRFIRVWESAQTSIDLINGDAQEIMSGHEITPSLVIKAFEKGVKTRVIKIIKIPGDQISKSFLTFARKPEYQVRYLPHFLVPVKIVIKDNEEVFISTSSDTSVLAQSYLWSNNPILVQVIQQWYDSMWEKCESRMQKGAVEIFESGAVM